MVLRAEDLRKNYRKKEVLKGVDFTINEGEVHAVLGRNGAGKSTFVKIALGLVFPSAGHIEIYGQRPGAQNHRIGYLSENITLYPHLSAADNLRVAAYSSGETIHSEQIEKLLDRIELLETNHKPAKSFSLGMKRRLQLAMATLIKPVDFLILDEPTNGLDVNGLLWLKKYMHSLKEAGISILLSSHAIADLQDVITHYDILKDGRIVKKGSWLNTTGIEKTYQIRFSATDVQNAAKLLSKTGRVEYAEPLVIRFIGLASFREILEILNCEKLIPEEITETKMSLEDVFLEEVGTEKT